jgi:DnaJ like chaperone protein
MTSTFLDLSEDIEAVVDPTFYWSSVIFLFLSLAFFLFRAISGQMWIKGIVPKTVKYNEENLFKIYLSLAVLMIKADRRKTETKRSHLMAYFQNKFDIDDEDYRYMFKWSFTNERIQIQSACNWLNKNVPDMGYQSQLLFFLAGIAIIDGSITRHERAILDKLAKGLKIPQQEINAIIASYQEQHYRQKRAEQRKNYRNQAKRSSSSKKKQMARILEISDSPTMDEVKKAYRTMAKLHHPDRFINNGPEQIKLAQERFIEIQKAYEYFEQLLK